MVKSERCLSKGTVARSITEHATRVSPSPQLFSPTNSPCFVGESSCSASRYQGILIILPARAKKALTAPSNTSTRWTPWLGWLSAFTFRLRYFSGYRTDHQKPKMKKQVPRRALPRKVVGIVLTCWTCKDKQGLGTNPKCPQERCQAAQHP